MVMPSEFIMPRDGAAHGAGPPAPITNQNNPSSARPQAYAIPHSSAASCLMTLGCVRLTTEGSWDAVNTHDKELDTK